MGKQVASFVIAAAVIGMVALIRAQSASQAISVSQWEYATLIAYNWNGAAYQRTSNPSALQASHVLNLKPKLDQLALGGWDVVSVTAVSGVPSDKPEISSEKFLVIVRKPRATK